MNPFYSNFFQAFGEATHFDSNYQSYTHNETKNTGHDLPQYLLAAASSAGQSLILMFKHIQKDYQSGALSKEQHGKYMRYYNLLLSDTITAARQLKKHPEIVESVKAFAAKKYCEPS